MQRDSDDDAWRAIVDNYGARADLEPEPGDLPQQRHELPDLPDEPDETPAEAAARDEDRFVPPAPPPVPRATPDRFAAWLGLFGAPAVLLAALVLNLPLPGWAGYLLVAAFVGGFGYLVVQMPRGPRDPGDDGARL
ncbi:hypothetical protein H5V45_03615 [Nocardioides sp. KIGAM211]|uniref:Uncharacterized protein n=1 Tax=Nocardioides luti TaxID=2761101 RepID=A0A7X0RDP2_9ACTN|nr:hypothetical protein [Nocardioides luti]MBB6626403.1 hypothetical protein [Nocardioides luti]